jgi:hypothetical protein
MKIAIILLLFILLPAVIAVIGIRKAKKERIRERDEMFYDDSDESQIDSDNSKKDGIDAVSLISGILGEEVEKAVKLKKKKPERKKKSEFPIEPVATKPKSKRGRKPKNKDKKGGDQMLLS